MASIREFTLAVTTRATGSPEVVLMGKGKMGRKSGAREISSRMPHSQAGCLLRSVFLHFQREFLRDECLLLFSWRWH